MSISENNHLSVTEAGRLSFMVRFQSTQVAHEIKLKNVVNMVAIVPLPHKIVRPARALHEVKNKVSMLERIERIVNACTAADLSHKFSESQLLPDAIVLLCVQCPMRHSLSGLNKDTGCSPIAWLKSAQDVQRPIVKSPKAESVVAWTLPLDQSGTAHAMTKKTNAVHCKMCGSGVIIRGHLDLLILI